MRLVKRSIAFAFVLVLLVAVSLTSYHWYRGADPGDALRMTVDDARVAARCPGEPGRVWDFVQRSRFEDLGVHVAKELGADWVEIVCEGLQVA